MIRVVKADGTSAKFDSNKIRKWVSWGISQTPGIPTTQVLDIEYSILQEVIRRLPEVVTTEEIHQTVIKVCLDKEELTYSRIAAELEKATLYKNLSRSGFLNPQSANFSELHDFFVKRGLWADFMSHLNHAQIEEVNEAYIELEALDLEYWVVKQFADKYSLKLNDKEVETPAMAALGIALTLHGFSELAFDVAKDICTYKTNLPTPVLNGIRNGNFDSISCCLIEGGDTVQSIAVAEYLAGAMTAKKAGIGYFLDTRSKGDPVKGGQVKHLGKAPLFHTLEKVVKNYTQITRGGSATNTIRCIDPDILEMLLFKTQRIDQQRRIDKIDYSFAYNDAFVEALIKKQDWYLFSRFHAPEVHDNFHAKDYMKYVRAALEKGVPHKKVKAMDVLVEFLKSRFETGRIYCINVTRMNEHTPFVHTIHQSNLCVAPETLILTDAGYIPIAELENEAINVWNGTEWSQTVVRKTGENQKLIKVSTNSGFELECTPYHKFYLAVGYKGATKEVRAADLKPGDKLIKLDTPVIQGSNTLDLAYENGFFSADGCVAKTHDRLYFYGDKIKSVYPHINKSVVYQTYDQPEHNRLYVHIKGMKEKFFVPMSNYSVESRLKWLAGYMDGDGSIYRNAGNEQLVAGSINKQFLLDVQLMLQTLGVQAKVTESKGTAGKKLLPKNDGSGELAEYECSQQWRLLITSNGLYKLATLGFKTNRLQWEGKKPQRDARQFIQVTSVEDLGRVDDTYCFTEPKKHLGVFNGLLTGQCIEIALPTSGFAGIEELLKNDGSHTGEVAFCALAALNVSAICLSEYFAVAERALRTVDRMIELAPGLHPALGYDIRKRRSVGIGITGLASFLYNQGLDYDGSYESLVAVEQLAATHYYALLSASQKMSAETGFAVADIDFDWLPVDTAKYVTDSEDWDLEYDWEALRGKPRMHSVLVAHMPCESSSAFSNSTNGLYPARKKVIYKAARTGRVQFIAPGFDGTKHKSVWDINMTPYYAAVQNYTDQAISADHYTDYTKYPNKKLPLHLAIDWFLEQAVSGVKTAYYQNFKDSEYKAANQAIEMPKADDADCSSCKL